MCESNSRGPVSVPGESSKETVKTTRAGNAGRFRCDRGDYTRMLILFCMRGCGRIARPAFPAPSDWRVRKSRANLGWIMPRDREIVSERHCEEPTGPAFGRPDDRLRDEAIQISACRGMDCFASLAMTRLLKQHAV